MKLKSKWTILLLALVCIGYILITNKESEFDKIEVTQFSYDQQRTSQSRKVKKTITLKEPDDIKVFIKVFKVKAKASGERDVRPMDFRIEFTKNGKVEEYDLSIKKDYVFFHDNGDGYFVRNVRAVKMLSNLFKKLGLD